MIKLFQNHRKKQNVSKSLPAGLEDIDSTKPTGHRKRDAKAPNSWSRENLESLWAQGKLQNSVLEFLDFPIYVIDARDYTVKLANSAANVGSLSKETTCYSLIHKRELPCVGSDHPCPLEKIKATRKSVITEHIHLDPEGNERYVEVHCHPILDHQGDVSHVIECTIDITDRKQAEKVLHQYEHIVSSTSDMMALLDTEYMYLAVNDAYVRAFKLTKDQVVGKPVPEVFGTQFFHEVIKPNADRCLAGEEVTYQQWFDFPAYPPRYMEIHYYPYKDKEGNIKGFVVNGRDITKRKQAEDELARHKDQLEELVRKRTCELQETNRLLQEEITERKQVEEKLIEYQKSLRTMALELSLAEEKERRRIAEELHDSVAQALVSSKLDLDSIQVGCPESEIHTALAHASQMIGKAIREIRTLTFDLSPPTLFQLGLESAISDLMYEQFHTHREIQAVYKNDGYAKPLDAEVNIVLYRSLRELLINVIKHARASNVTVSVHRRAGHIHIILEDDGIGFDSAHLEQYDRAKGGYGLFSIRERMRYLGGNMNIESRQGRGTRVTLTCPLKPPSG